MASNQQILADLKVIMETNQNLELLCTYKGVPFVCKAKVQNLDEGLARVHALDPSIVCLIQDAQAKILGSDYFEPANATVVSINLAESTIDLTDFTYISSRLGERMIVRVEPRQPIEVQIDCVDCRISGEMVDISISGIGVRVPLDKYDITLRPGANLQLAFTLTTGEIKVGGIVLSAMKSAGFQRLSVRFSPESTQRSLIFKYLIERRAEIEQEVDDKFRNAILAA
jgi:hypothetical protein